MEPIQKGKQTNKTSNMCASDKGKQTNKQAEVACVEVQMQGAVQSCITCGVRYAMHQSTQKSFGDALGMHRKSAEFDMQGRTLTVMPLRVVSTPPLILICPRLPIHQPLNQCLLYPMNHWHATCIFWEGRVANGGIDCLFPWGGYLCAVPGCLFGFGVPGMGCVHSQAHHGQKKRSLEGQEWKSCGMSMALYFPSEGS